MAYADTLDTSDTSVIVNQDHTKHRAYMTINNLSDTIYNGRFKEAFQIFNKLSVDNYIFTDDIKKNLRNKYHLYYIFMIDSLQIPIKISNNAWSLLVQSKEQADNYFYARKLWLKLGGLKQW